MSNGRLSEFAQICGGALKGEDRTFTGVSTDTRALKANNLFVALNGPNFDGHEFLDQAQDLGAAGYVLSKPGYDHLPQVLVEDNRKAMAVFATNWRQRFSIPVAAITGSNGKTSTKEMLAAILAVKHKTLATTGNMNNDIGVPLTLFRLGRSHRSAVIELGTNAPGEIAFLTSLVLPTVGLITNAASAHLSGLGSVEGVAKEKGALLEGLEPTATAVINSDDPHAPLWRDMSNAETCFEFGANSSADFHFDELQQTVNGSSARLKFKLATPMGTRQMEVPMAGAHNAANAAAAAASAYAMGIGLGAIEAGLAKANGVAGRMQIHTATCGARIINDSYNANPASARAAIEFLADQREPGWLVLGDMGELGSNAPDMHASIGKYARELGVERLFAVGNHSNAAALAFGDNAKWYEDSNDLVEELKAELKQGINVLIKGSRSMQLERISDALQTSQHQAVSTPQSEGTGLSKC